MRITIFGTGYVGLVTGACFAESGHSVLCIDKDKNKIEKLSQGIVPIYEPGLDQLVKEMIQQKKLSFTVNEKQAVDYANLIIIAVGTPQDEDGSADLQYVLQVAETIASNMESDKIVVNKSTVPVGTAEKVKQKIKNILLQKQKISLKINVVSNPEFLKEGSAINDFRKPDRIIIGIDSEYSSKIMHEVYAPFNRNHNKLIEMDIRSAELTKYVANAMLATKISFMNEMANFAELVGADIEKVRQGIGADQRIGYHFIYPGCGYGGSCFPKDIKALINGAEKMRSKLPILSAVEQVNLLQKRRLFLKITSFFGAESNLKGKTFALWGLAFKPNTDDMREAPSRVLLEDLWSSGALIQAFDPKSMNEAKRIYGERHDLIFVQNKEEALEGADALIICTEWQDFRSIDFHLVKSKLKNPVIFDGRNLYDPVDLANLGFLYYGIGRSNYIHSNDNVSIDEDRMLSSEYCEFLA